MTKEKSLFIYIILFFISALLFSYGNRVKNKGLKTILKIISIIIPVLIAGLRYNVGTDYENYVNSYFLVTNDNYRIEIFHKLVVMIVQHTFNYYQYIFLIYALVTILIAYKAIDDYKIDNKNTFILTYAYLMLYFIMSLNLMRQCLAVAIIMYSMKYIYNKKIYKYIFCIILATLVHTSALIILPFGIVNIISKDAKKGIIISLIVYITFSIFLLLIPVSILNNIPFINKFLNYVNINESLTGTGFGIIIKQSPILLLCACFYKKMIKNDANIKQWIAMEILNIIFLYVGFINIALNRFSMYFSFATIFIIQDFYGVIKKDLYNKIFTQIIMIIVITSIMIYNVYYLNIGELLPYQINSSFIDELN